ncbi:hypothetical protein [Streptomyces filamentosus]|uniref:hypothetical protein n=1 Tax=Streptomyces filamentosus TaxID=67294 RepID=UPI0033271F9A
MPGTKRRTPSGEATPKGVPGVLAGTVPEARGELTLRPVRNRPEAVTLSVSVQADRPTAGVVVKSSGSGR